MAEQRSNYDRMMQENFHAQPFPTPRTAEDKKLQQRWCPTCKFGSYTPPFTPPNGATWEITEKYTKPTPNFRTIADKELQQKWCPNCSAIPTNCPPCITTKRSWEGYSAMHDWDNSLSYTYAPYRV